MNTKIDLHVKKIADLMVDKINQISTNWTQPWINYRAAFIPQNYNGHRYSFGNALTLILLSERENFQTPVFLTFNQANALGICVKKGSTSFPVYYSDYICVEKTTQEKIKFEDYKKLDKEAKKDYSLIPFIRYYLVFNLDQTDFAERHPDDWSDIYLRFNRDFSGVKTAMYKNDKLDSMLNNQSWVCPIEEQLGNKACYIPRLDKIIMPDRKQFEDGTKFYSTLMHEMVHSTGIKKRLNRRGFTSHSNYDYGREELVAEFTSALMCFFLGITTSIQDDNAQYLKSWIQSIRKEPKFLLSVLTDCSRAVNFINEKLDINFETVEELAVA